MTVIYNAKIAKAMIGGGDDGLWIGDAQLSNKA